MSRGATARLFVAVDPPARVREELCGWGRRVASGMRAAGASRGALRLLEEDSLHLTLCFLGSRPVAEIEALAGAVGACAEPACELSVGAPLWLPPRRPHALAVEIHDHGGRLTRIREQLSLALVDVSGWEPQRRRFKPHITLARVRAGMRRARPERSRPEQPLPPTPRLDFTPPQIVLYRSWLAPEGASYEALARGELAPDSH
jgi:RNA 2',3'-cyclic 3'-phosphodiesterase